MIKSKLKFCVLGATSFGGRTVIESLLAQGYFVLGVARRGLPLEPYKIKNVNPKNLNWLRADLVTENHLIIECINSFSPDYIIDFMGQGMVAESWVSPFQWYNTNVSKKSELLSKLDWQKFLKAYIRVSTPEVFGSVDELITEKHSFNPSTPYALSHASIDQHLALYASQTDFPFIIARYANFYGKGQQLYRIVPKALYYALTGQKLTLDGGGISERSFIYRDDIASSMNALIKNGKVGETYHFSDTKCISIKSLVQKIANCCGIDFKDFVQIGADRNGKDQKYLMSTAKAQEKLGWNSKTDLDEGITKTMTWIKKSKKFISPELLKYQHNYRENHE
jgi:dTDP-glucose 4,6-dehydratase